MSLYVIGAGGTGAWLLPILLKQHPHDDVTIMDGDLLESRNLDRQFFTREDIGQFKAETLAKRYGCDYRNEWYTSGVLEMFPGDWMIVCVDNHVARKHALHEADAFGNEVIITANESNSAEAYYYSPNWQGQPTDPRVFYPEITRDDSNNPIMRTGGCAGEINAGNTQLALANFIGAALAMQLFNVWRVVARQLREERSRDMLPHHILSVLSSVEVRTVESTLKGQHATRDKTTGGEASPL